MGCKVELICRVILLYKILAWEPRVVIVSSTVYPRVVVIYDFSYFSHYTSKYQNQTKNIPVALPSSPIIIQGKSVQEFLIYDRTNKQTGKI